VRTAPATLAATQTNGEPDPRLRSPDDETDDVESDVERRRCGRSTADIGGPC
jgi:hypothetical protein